MKTYPQSDPKEAKQLWSKIWEERDYNRKAERINKEKKSYKGLEKENTLRFTQSNTQKGTKLENARSLWLTWILVFKKSLPFTI